MSEPTELAQRVLKQADQVYLTVRTAGGPHVTPELFSTTGDLIICMAAAPTLKVKKARIDTEVGIAAITSDGCLAGVAQVALLDPKSPGTALADPVLALKSPLAVARFVRDNAAELSGAAMDFLEGKLGGLVPPRRVMLAVSLEAVAVVDDSGEIETAGFDGDAFVPLDDEAGEGGAEEQTIPLDQLQPELRELVKSGDAVVGWVRHDDRPLALPARWDDAAGSATVSRTLFEACGGAPRSSAAVTFDAWSGLGPSGKQGLMLRGSGEASAEGDLVRLSFDFDRATTWDGVQTNSSRLDGAS